MVPPFLYGDVMLVTRYVLKNLETEMYVEAHSSAKNILWDRDLSSAKVFRKIRHAERWFKRLTKDDGVIKMVEVRFHMRNRIRDWKRIEETAFIERVAPMTDVDKILAGEPIEKIPEPIQKINGLWDFIPRERRNKYEDRHGYTGTGG